MLLIVCSSALLAEKSTSLHAAFLNELNALWNQGDKALIKTFSEDTLANVGFASAIAGRIDMLDWCFKRHKTDFKEIDRFGNTIWLIAAFEGQTEVLQWLIEHDISGILNENDRGINIWLSAASRGHLDTLKWLKHHKIAHQDHRDKEGYNLWGKAVLLKENQRAILDWLNSEKISGKAYLQASLKRLLPLIIDQEAIPSLQWLFDKKVLNARELARFMPHIWKTAAFIRDEQANHELLDLLASKRVPGQKLLTKNLKEILPQALQFGALGTLTWLLEHKVITKHELSMHIPSIWEKAATTGNENMRKFLEFFDEKKIPGRASFVKSLPKLLPDLLFLGATDVLQWLLDTKLLSKEKLHRLAPNIWLDVAGRDLECAPVAMVQWLIKNEIPGAQYADKKGNTIWLMSGQHIDIADILLLLLHHKIPGVERVNQAGKNVWHNAAESGSLRALKLLHEYKIPGFEQRDKAGRDIWYYAKKAPNAASQLEWLLKLAG